MLLCQNSIFSTDFIYFIDHIDCDFNGLNIKQFQNIPYLK